MAVIEVKHLTKDYGHNRGIYDVSLLVGKEETLGFLGPNGAGKSTTMRHLIGFSKLQKGTAQINGCDCWKQHGKIMEEIGYLLGEIALPEGLNGVRFIHMMQGLRKRKDSPLVQELLKRFQLRLDGDVRKMSIGEKRKLAVVAAFMNDPKVLLLDEPTSGLDPVMQKVFIEFVKEQKEKGKTILLSSHIFSEVEALCDRIVIIKEGKIITIINAQEVEYHKRKTFEIIFPNDESYQGFQHEDFKINKKDEQSRMLSVVLENGQTNQFIRTAAKYSITKLVEHPWTLEEYFMKFYKTERTFGGI